MFPTQLKSMFADSICQELGHVGDKDNPLGRCLDCGCKLDDDGKEIPEVGKKNKGITVTKGASTPKAPDPPRVYRPLSEFIGYVPGAPPMEVLPPRTVK